MGELADRCSTVLIYSESFLYNDAEVFPPTEYVCHANKSSQGLSKAVRYGRPGQRSFIGRLRRTGHSLRTD